jgi:hypothetical protein
VQGITTDKVVVSLKNIFAAGMAYVALSRVTSLHGLVIRDFDEQKIYYNEQITNALQQMPQYLTQPITIVREPNPYFPLNLELRVKVFFSADSGTLRVTFHHPSG